MDGTQAIHPWRSQDTGARGEGGCGRSAGEMGPSQLQPCPPRIPPLWAGQSPATWSLATKGRTSPGVTGRPGSGGGGGGGVCWLSSSGSLVFSFRSATSFRQLTQGKGSELREPPEAGTRLATLGCTREQNSATVRVYKRPLSPRVLTMIFKLPTIPQHGPGLPTPRFSPLLSPTQTPASSCGSASCPDSAPPAEMGEAPVGSASPSCPPWAPCPHRCTQTHAPSRLPSQPGRCPCPGGPVSQKLHPSRAPQTPWFPELCSPGSSQHPPSGHAGQWGGRAWRERGREQGASAPWLLLPREGVTLGRAQDAPGLLPVPDVGLPHRVLVEGSCFSQLQVGADQRQPGREPQLDGIFSDFSSKTKLLGEKERWPYQTSGRRKLTRSFRCLQVPRNAGSQSQGALSEV